MPDIIIGNQKQIKKDLYQETMNLINGNVNEKQFLKDNFYYNMVEEIYKNGFERIGKNAEISDYVREGVSIYKKLNDLNQYFGLCFDPDMTLLVYVTGQFLNYFKDRKVIQGETKSTFMERLHQALPHSNLAPFERMNILQGAYIRLNDKIYKTKKNNKNLVEETGLSREFIMKLRSGRLKLTKDIVYMLSLAMHLSWTEFSQLMETLKISWGEEKTFDKYLKEILDNFIQLSNLDRNGKMTAVQVANNYLEERGSRSLSIKVSKVKERENVRTVLITGGLGFIGRNCIDYFKKLNEKGDTKYRICVLTRKHPKKNDIPEGIICYAGESDNTYVYERIFIENDVDYILHLAGVSDVEKGEQEPAETFNASSISAICDAILSNHIRIKGLIFASTQLVYKGKIDTSLEWRESDPLDSTMLDNYAKAKYIAEVELQSFAEKGIPIMIARLANVYGTGDHSLQRLIPKTIQLIKEGKAPQIYVNKISRKSAKKNFLFVEDLAKAFYTIMELSDNKIYAPNAIENTYNIGGEKTFFVEDVVNLLIKLMKSDVRPEYVLKDQIYKEEKLSVAKAKNRLGFIAETTLEEGLKKTIEWYDKKREQ